VLAEHECPHNHTQHSTEAAKRKLAHAAFLYAICSVVCYPIVYHRLSHTACSSTSAPDYTSAGRELCELHFAILIGGGDSDTSPNGAWTPESLRDAIKKGEAVALSVGHPAR
jgi:hypothetical protein